MQEGLVRLRVASIEHHNGVGEPGEDPPPNHLRLPGKATHRLVQLEEIAEQGFGLLTLQLAASDPQMPEPAEAVKLARPCFGRRHDLEGRLRAKLDQAGGKTEMAVVDLGGKARIGGAQVLGRKQELFSFSPRIRQARHAQEHEAAKRAQPARKLSARPALAGKGVSRHAQSSRIFGPPANQAPRGLPQNAWYCRTAAGQDQEAWGPKAAWKALFVAFQARGEEPVHAAPFRRPEVELVGKSPQEPWGLQPFGLPKDLTRQDRVDLNSRVSGKQRSNLALAFLELERAGGIDERPAWLEKGCGIVEKPRLQGGQRLDVPRRFQIGNVRMPPDGPGG